MLDVLEQGQGHGAGGDDANDNNNNNKNNGAGGGDLFVKVEQDCGTVLIDAVTAPRSIEVRIPENWVVHILRQLVQGVFALHSVGFVHLDLSLENCVCNFETGACVRTCVCVGVALALALGWNEWRVNFHAGA